MYSIIIPFMVGVFSEGILCLLCVVVLVFTLSKTLMKSLILC